MITVNDTKVNIEHFLDGTQRIKFDEPADDFHNDYMIKWKYESEEELISLIFISKHLRTLSPSASQTLVMRYIPNARMDRVKKTSEVFTLKYFAEIINSLNFEYVLVKDVHSPVSLALLNNVHEISAESEIRRVIKKINEEVVLYFPDAGAQKRYEDVFKYPYIYGVKHRDFSTGKITGLSVETNGVDIKGKTILMIDDIISYGGSMHYSVQKLKELGASDIYAYATHTENSILDPDNGTLIKDIENGVVKKLYTTDSLYTGSHPLIETL